MVSILIQKNKDGEGRVGASLAVNGADNEKHEVMRQATQTRQ